MEKIQKRNYRSKDQVEKDGVAVISLCDRGYNFEEIIIETGLSKNQILYSLKGSTYENLSATSKRTTKRNNLQEVVVIDTSFCGAHGMKDIIKDKTVIFQTLVIEELDHLKRDRSNANDIIHAATFLLREALKSHNLVKSTVSCATLEGWNKSNSSDSDSRIVQTAFNLKSEYNVTLYTCDILMCLKAKNLGLAFEFFECYDQVQKDNPFNKESSSDQTPKPTLIFKEIGIKNETTSLPLVKKGKFSYLKESESLCSFYNYASGLILKVTDHHPVNGFGRLIFASYSDRIEVLKIENFTSSNNAKKIGVGYFSELLTINPNEDFLKSCFEELKTTLNL